MRWHNVSIVNFSETPQALVSGEDAELVTKATWLWELEVKGRKERHEQARVFCTTQLSACLCVPECVSVRKNHVGSYLGVPVV